MDETDSTQLVEIEQEYEYEDLLLWRKLANTACKLEQEQRRKLREQPQARGGLMEYFWGSSSSAAQISAEVQETALADLYESIGFDSSSKSLYRDDLRF